MAREVTHDATGPLRLDADDIESRGGRVLVCRCGLSGEYPFCDGSHEATSDEDRGAVYRYTGEGRREIREVVVGDGENDRDDENDEDETERPGWSSDDGTDG